MNLDVFLIVINNKKNGLSTYNRTLYEVFVKTMQLQINNACNNNVITVVRCM